MKRLFAIISLLTAIFMTAVTVHGQIVLPDENPRAMLTQDLGFNSISVEYNRPSTEGHIIFGERIPYGEEWLNNGRTYMRVSVSGTVMINDSHELGTGNYYLTVIPGEAKWDIIFRSSKPVPNPMVSWYAPDIEFENVALFKPGDELFRFNVTPERMKEKVESLTVQFASVCATCSQMQIMWDYTRISFNVSTEVDAEILEDIKSFTHNPELKLSGQFYLAAKYYFETGRDLDQALEWVNKSLEYAPEAYWVLHTKAEILAEMKDYRGAIDAAEQSMTYAEKSADMDYVRINQMEIDRWKKLRKGSL